MRTIKLNKKQLTLEISEHGNDSSVSYKGNVLFWIVHNGKQLNMIKVNQVAEIMLNQYKAGHIELYKHEFNSSELT